MVGLAHVDLSMFFWNEIEGLLLYFVGRYLGLSVHTKS